MYYESSRGHRIPQSVIQRARRLAKRWQTSAAIFDHDCSGLEGYRILKEEHCDDPNYVDVHLGEEPIAIIEY